MKGSENFKEGRMGMAGVGGSGGGGGEMETTFE